MVLDQASRFAAGVQKGTRAVANCNHLKPFKINLCIPKVPPIQPTSFGQFLKKLRLDKKLSQRGLARLLDVSHDSIRNWEGDSFLPKILNMALANSTIF